jgi:hypothetical protein
VTSFTESSASTPRALSGQALTVVSRIKPSAVIELTRFLDEIGTDIAHNAHIRFADLTRVHFLRWVVLADDQRFAPSLAFESNYDGTLDQHLDEMTAVAGPALVTIYAACENFPPPDLAGATPAEQVKAFMKAGAQPYGAFFRAYPGTSAAEVRQNTRVYATAQGFIDQRFGGARQPRRDSKPEPIRAEIAGHVQPALPDVTAPAPGLPESWRDSLARLLMDSPVVLILVALLLLPILLPWVVVLLIHEFSDHDDGKQADQVDGALRAQEDHKTQNQLNIMVDVKPGWFRLTTLKIVLWAIDFLGRHYFSHGALGGITSIHFARWVLLDGGRRLLFFSNYDGSWESYLGDFVDRASAGLSAVWSNTVGFPPTRLLVLSGARNEDEFKQWARNHQLRTQLWYSAHASESVQNILNNVQIRAGLFDPATDSQSWLARL